MKDDLKPKPTFNIFASNEFLKETIVALGINSLMSFNYCSKRLKFEEKPHRKSNKPNFIINWQCSQLGESIQTVGDTISNEFIYTPFSWI